MNLKFVAPSLALISVGLVAFAQPAAPKSEPGRDQPAPSRGQPAQPGEPGPGGPGGPGGARRGNAGSPQTIEAAMKLMNGNFRRLRGQVSDATKKDDNLKLVNEMQRGAVIAKGLDPTEAFKKETDAAKKAKMVGDYRHHMIELLEKLITLEKQILDGKTEDAAKTVQSLQEYKIENHDLFGVKED